MKRTPPPDREPPVRLTAEERSYFEAVEAHFIRLRGRPLILSPRELERVAGWHREGIPLRVVCRGIDRYFQKRFDSPSARQRAVTLEYCEKFVRQALEESRELSVGSAAQGRTTEDRGGSELETGLQQLLQRLQTSLNTQGDRGNSLEPLLERVVSVVQDLLERAGRSDQHPSITVQTAEEELEKLDREVAGELQRLAGPEGVARIRDACDAEMRELAASMDPALYRTTLQRMTIRRLKQEYHVPEISLFSL